MSRPARSIPTGSSNSPLKTNTPTFTSYAQTAKQVQKQPARVSPSSEASVDKKPISSEVKPQAGGPSNVLADASSTLLDESNPIDKNITAISKIISKFGPTGVSLPEPVKSLTENKYTFLNDNEPFNDSPQRKLYSSRSIAFGEGISPPGPIKAFSSSSVVITATFHLSLPPPQPAKEPKAVNNSQPPKKTTNVLSGTVAPSAVPVPSPSGPFVPAKHPSVPISAIPAPGAPFSSLNPVPSGISSHNQAFTKQAGVLPGSVNFPQPNHFGQFAPPHGAPHNLQPGPPINGPQTWHPKPNYSQGAMPSPNQSTGYRSPHSRGQDKPSFSGPPVVAGFTPSSNSNTAITGPGMSNTNWSGAAPYNYYAVPFDSNYPSPYPNFVPQTSYGNAHMPPPTGINSSLSLNSNAAPFTPKANKAIKIINPNTLSEVVPSNVVKKDTNPTTPASSTPTSAVRISKPTTQTIPANTSDSQPSNDVKSESSKVSLVSEVEAPETIPSKDENQVVSSEPASKPQTDSQTSVKSEENVLPTTVKESAPVEPVKLEAIQEPTIIATKSETVLLTKTKAKPKRSIRAEAGAKASQASEPTAASVQSTVSKKDTEVESKTDVSSEAPAQKKLDSSIKIFTNEPEQNENHLTVGANKEKETPLPASKPSETVPQSLSATGAPPGFAELKPSNETNLHSENINGNIAELRKPILTRLTSSTPSTPGRSSPTPSSPRIVEFFEQVNYPPNINRPHLPDGKFKYDRTFLLQFREMCTDKPEDMKMIESLTDDNLRSDSMDRKNSNQRHIKPNRAGMRPDQMNFGSKPKNSEERFNLSNLQMRNDVSGRSPLVSRTSSSTMLPTMNHQQSLGKDSRNRGGRGGRGSKHGSQHFHQHGNNSPTPTIPLEDVEPLKPTENRWVPKKTDTEDKESRFNRKVKALLNKLTLEKFDSISTQIIDIANESAQEKNGETLKLCIKLVFEKATDEPNFSAMYAQLCSKMQQSLSPEIHDEEIQSKDGSFTSGGILFRKYLLTRCQQEFMKGWKTEEVAKLQGSVDLMSEEYYIAAKAKRQGLGLIRFIGELFKLGMLTERIMHECINGMLQKEPDEEEIESLFKLMSTIGKKVDSNAGQKSMNNYFARITDLSKDDSLSQRSRFMLQDLIDLRKNNWENRRGAASGPKTLQEIKEDADREAEEKLRQEKLRRTASSGGGRGPGSFHAPRSERHDSKEKNRTTDGWNTVGAQSPISRNKTGDLSSFGNLSRSKTNTTSLSLGPSSGSVFTSLGSLKGSSFRESPSQSKKVSPASSLNMFNMLAAESGSEPKASESATRPTLKLLPKTSTTSDAPKEQSDEAFKLKVENTAKELFALSDMKEAMLSLTELSAYSCNDEVIFQLMLAVIERKASDVALIAKLFAEANREEVISFDDFIAGAKNMIARLDDISIDAPGAFDHMATMLMSYPTTLTHIVDFGESMAEEPSMISPGSKLFIAFVKAHRQSTDGEANLLKEYEANNHDLTRLFHKEANLKLCVDKLISNSQLEFLLPVIKASSWYSGLESN